MHSSEIISFVSVGIRCISGTSAVMAAQPKAAAKNPGMNIHLFMKASIEKSSYFIMRKMDKKYQTERNNVSPPDKSTKRQESGI